MREDFLITLTNPLIGKLWECINFKEFLEEKSSTDELFFYLHCRFLLNKGPQMDVDGATFNYVHLIKNDHANFIIDLILSNFEEPTRQFIKQKVNEKTKFKTKQIMIDSSFVLRILLEYYRLERKQKFKLIQSLFLSLPATQIIKKKLAINSFKIFKYLIDKIHVSCSEITKAELFREAWQVGLGEITPEVFFTVLTESHFFVSTMKLRSFLNVPLTNQITNQDDYMNVTKIFNLKLHDQNNDLALQEMERILEEMGSEKMIFLWHQTQKVFSDNYKYIDFEGLCGKIPESNFFQMVKIIINCLSIRNFNYHLKSDSYSEFNDVLRDWQVYQGLFDILRKQISDNRIKEFEKTKKVKKIQDLVKRKVRKWYVLINKLLKKKK